jgi:site-specific DNA recombinase
VYGGYRLHQPGGNGQHRGSMEGAVDAVWPPLVDRDLLHAVRRMLMSPDRKTWRPGSGVHLLSLIARCGAVVLRLDENGKTRPPEVCSGPLTASYRRRRPLRDYECRDGGHVSIDADALDDYAEEKIYDYLVRDDVIAMLRARPEAGSELARVRADLDAARSELDILRKAAEKAAGEGRLSVGTLLAVEPAMVKRIEGLEALERELTTPGELAWLIEPGEDIARRWAAAPMSARRQAARQLYSPAMLGTLRVKRSPVPGHQVDVSERVELGDD